MTEISAIIRARLNDGRSISDEDVRGLLNENEKLREALAKVDTRIKEAEAKIAFGCLITNVAEMQAMHEAATEITRLRAKVDAVYSERNRLAAAFARMAFAAGFKAGKGVDPDETKWPVVYVDTPNGQVSWHIAEADQGVLEGLPQYNGEWDGKFTARDPAWSVWPAADLVATARRDAMKELERHFREAAAEVLSDMKIISVGRQPSID